MLYRHTKHNRYILLYKRRGQVNKILNVFGVMLAGFASRTFLI